MKQQKYHTVKNGIWVDNKFKIHEYAISSIQIHSMKAQTFLSVIKDDMYICTISRFASPRSVYRASIQWGSNMSVILSGIHALVKSESKRALDICTLFSSQLTYLVTDCY